MTEPEIREAFQAFLEFVDGSEGSEDDALERLAFHLDRIALARHYAPKRFDERTLPDAPRAIDRRDRVRARFSSLGYYNVAEHTAREIAHAGCIVGDAIDDICDIAGDLEEVLWRWEHNSAEDALWHRHELHGHWGMHLRDLQRVLHVRGRRE